MALLERLAILITADAAGAINEMKKVADEAEKNLGKAGAAGSTLSGQMTKVGATMVGVGAGLLAVGISSANTTESLGKEVIKLQRYTGLSAEEASKLGYAARMTGVDVDSLSLNLARMAKQMDTSPQKFTALGVEVKTSDGHLRSMGDVLLDVADKFKQMGPGTETSAKALELFGRQGANMLPFLLKGKEGIQELTGEAEKMGLVLSQDNVNAVREHIKAQRELKATIDGIKNQIGQEMLPILTDFTKLVSSIPGPLKDIAGPLVVVGGGIALVGGAALIAAGQIQKLVVAYGELSTVSQVGLGLLGAVGIALTAVSVVYSVYRGQVQAAEKATAKFNDEVLATAKKGSFNELTDTLDRFNQQLDYYALKAGKKGLFNGGTDFFFWDRSKAEGQYNETKKLTDQLSNYRDMAIAVADATGKTRDETYKWVVAQGEAGVKFTDAKQAIGAYTGMIDVSTLSANNARVAQDGLATSIENANNAYRAAVDPFFAVIHAQEDLATQTKAYQDLLGSGKASQAEIDAAFLKQVESATKLQSTLVELGKATVTGSTDTAKFQQAMEFLRQYGIDPSSEQGRRLAERIAGIRIEADATARFLNDNPLGVKVDDSSLEAVERRLFFLRNSVNALTGYVGLEDVYAAGRALGGRVGQGYVAGGRPQPYMVGELGPELFIPDQAGTIVTADKTRELMGGQQVGDVNVYVNQSNASPYEIGRELAWTLKVTR